MHTNNAYVITYPNDCCECSLVYHGNLIKVTYFVLLTIQSSTHVREWNYQPKCTIYLLTCLGNLHTVVQLKNT